MYHRRIFTLSGFDPRGARFYHRLLGAEIAAARAHGEALALSPRQGARWQVTSPPGPDGLPALHADFHDLAWDDIVRAHWPRGTLWPLRALASTLRFAFRLDSHVLRKAPRGALVTLFYPALSLVAVPLAMLALALTLAALLARSFPGAALFTFAIPLTLGGIASWRLTPRLLRHLHSLWLARFVVFNDALARAAPPPDLADRLDSFAETLAETLAHEPCDEILLVCHSNGTVLGAALVARLLERLGAPPAHFAFVTLGSSIPLIGGRRDAAWFHAALDRLGTAQFRWLDLASLTDGACTGPLAPCAGRPVERPSGLVQLSPRWFRYADPATYEARRRDKYRTHFDYLRRLAQPSPLDYLSLTCGTRPIDAAIAAFRAENG